MDELTDARTAELTATLHRLEQELVTALAETDADVRPVDLGLPIGRLSRMDAMQQQSMAKAGRAAYQRRLAGVRRALSDVADGEYGCCKSCAEPIGHERLSARPEAPLCIACQELAETS